MRKRGDIAIEDVLVVEHHGDVRPDIDRHTCRQVRRNVETALLRKQSLIPGEIAHVDAGASGNTETHAGHDLILNTAPDTRSK